MTCGRGWPFSLTLLSPADAPGLRGVHGSAWGRPSRLAMAAEGAGQGTRIHGHDGDTSADDGSSNRMSRARSYPSATPKAEASPHHVELTERRGTRRPTRIRAAAGRSFLPAPVEWVRRARAASDRSTCELLLLTLASIEPRRSRSERSSISTDLDGSRRISTATLARWRKGLPFTGRDVGSHREAPHCPSREAVCRGKPVRSRSRDRRSSAHTPASACVQSTGSVPALL